MDDSKPEQSRSYLVYDGDCPFCSEYVKLLRLRESVGHVELVTARGDHPVVNYLDNNGFDLNEGIAFIERGIVYFGDQAITHLALLTTPVGFFNRFNVMLFKRPGVTAVVYPVLKSGRRLTLWILGRSPIEHTSRSENH